MTQNVEVKISFQKNENKCVDSVQNKCMMVSIDGKEYPNFDEIPFDIKMRIVSELDAWQDRLYSHILENR